MDEFIKRKEAYKAAVEKTNNPTCPTFVAANILQSIMDIPVADVEPVRHGSWLNDELYEYICSECGKYAPFNLDIYGETADYYHNNLTNYCPNCGAKMEKRGIK